MLFKNATIYTMEQEPFVGDFKIDKGVFTEVGKDLTPDEGDSRFKWSICIPWFG